MTSRLIRIYTVFYSAFDFRLKPHFASVDVSKFKDGRVHLRNFGMKTDTFSNNVEPDETARDEPSHQDLHCLLVCFFIDFILKPLFASMDMSKYKD